MTPQSELVNPGNGPNGLDHEELIYIRHKDAKKKFNLANSSVSYWVKQGKVRPHPTNRLLVVEADVAAIVNDPGYQLRSQARRKVLANRRNGGKPKRQYVRRGQAAVNVKANSGPELGHHVAYLAGRTDEFLANYARSFQLNERDLAQGLAQILATR